jgi:hypothetical protein
MPASLDDVHSAGTRLGFIPPAEHLEDYQTLLQGTDAACEELLALPGASPVEAAVVGGD